MRFVPVSEVSTKGGEAGDERDAQATWREDGSDLRHGEVEQKNDWK